MDTFKYMEGIIAMKEDKKFIGCINLGLMTKCVAGKMKKHGFLFYLNTSKETFLFKVQSNEQRHRWFKAINESAAKSNKIDSQSNELTHQNLSFIQTNPTVDTNLYVTDEKNVESNETNETDVESKVSSPIQVNSSVNSKPLNIINVLPYNEETNNKNTNNASFNTIEENVIPNNTMLNNLSSKNNPKNKFEVVNFIAPVDQIYMHNIFIANEYFC
ncbi:probable basic-leucine zipper transcription factor G isoform X4 [Hydra vulgaris]|uniref:Probable basic-leucine zipper transcription factor G isoform X4 n=1 Tax=Hydra vulgaris TaxID=6087 RepID=A0ABM4C498_HYDVU